jgi:glutathione S-transferase
MVTLHYFPLYGRVEYVNMILKHAGADFTEKVIQFQDWGETKASGLCPTGSLPILTDGDRTVSNTPAIAYYLANKHGLLPESADGHVTTICVIDHLEGFKTPWFTKFFLTSNPEGAREWFDGASATFFKFLEDTLAASGGAWFTGEKFTYVDIAVFELLHDVFVRPVTPEYAEDLNAHTQLKAFHDAVLVHSPGIKAHLETRPTYPI